MIRRGTCGICNCFCAIEAEVEDNRIRSVRGDRNSPLTKGYICPKGRALGEIIHAKDRVTTPLLKNKSGVHVPVTWEKALEVLAKWLGDVREQDGAEKVAVHTGQAGVFMQFTAAAERFCQLFGTPNFSTAGSHCNTLKELANVVTVGGLPVPDYERADVIVLWGYNPTHSAPAQMLSLNAGLRKGAKLVVIDPYETDLAKRADHHLCIRPGTDGALALGLIHEVIRQSLFDSEFVNAWTVGFEDLKIQASPYTIKRVSEITGIREKQIQEVCQMFKPDKRVNFSPGIAIELQSNGFQTARAISILQAITGNIDVAGGSTLAAQMKLKPIVLDRCLEKGGTPIGGDQFPLFRKLNGRAQANFFCDAILQGEPHDLKAMLIVGSNPLLTWPNSNRVASAFESLKHLIVMDLFMTKTGQMADLFLPARHHNERFELWSGAIRYGHEVMGVSWPIVENPSGCSEWELFYELAHRLGHQEDFPWSTEKTALDYRLSGMGLTVEDFKNMNQPYAYGDQELQRYLSKGFNTATRKIELYSQMLKDMGIAALPDYDEPEESPQGSSHVKRAYPLVLTTGSRSLEYYHSRFHNIERLIQYKNNAEPCAVIHPCTAERYGLEHGDWVKIESRRGSLCLAVTISKKIKEDVVSIPHGWEQANANELVNHKGMDPVTGFPPARALMVRLTKIDRPNKKI